MKFETSVQMLLVHVCDDLWVNPQEIVALRQTASGCRVYLPDTTILLGSMTPLEVVEAIRSQLGKLS